MFEIAGSILVAVFVLTFFRVFLALGILLISFLLIGLLAYFFDVEWVLRFFKLILMSPVLWGIGVLAFLCHWAIKKDEELTKIIQSRHALLYELQSLFAKIQENNIAYNIVARKYLIYRYFYEVNIGSFWLVYEKYRFGFTKNKTSHKIKILDSNKIELFSVQNGSFNKLNLLSYSAKSIDFDFDLLSKELSEYLSNLNEKLVNGIP